MQNLKFSGVLRVSLERLTANLTPMNETKSIVCSSEQPSTQVRGVRWVSVTCACVRIMGVGMYEKSEQLSAFIVGGMCEGS